MSYENRFKNICAEAIELKFQKIIEETRDTKYSLEMFDDPRNYISYFFQNSIFNTTSDNMKYIIIRNLSNNVLTYYIDNK